MIACLLITGCTVVRIDTDSITNITGVIVEKDNSLYNRVGKGYKYYIPRGVSYIDTVGFNDTLYSKGIYYYLYIDAPAYINKIDLNYEKENIYYSQELDINGKKGYIKIYKKDNEYLIRCVYNYASIEAMVGENHINEFITNAAYILSSIKYNDNIIKMMLDENYENREEQYKEFISNGTTGNFLKAPDDIVEE